MSERYESWASVATLARGRYVLLAGALLLLGAMYPLLGWGLAGLTLWTVAFWSVLLGALYAVGTSRDVRRLARILAALAFASGVAGLACYNLRESGHDWIFSLFDGLTLLFLLLATGRIVHDVVFRAAISTDHLVGAACAYILLGLTFAFVLSVLDGLTVDQVLSPVATNSLQAATDSGLVRAEYLYFSFVTLSTLGYGDLAPLTLTARLVAGVEAIVGQLFLTILVARLIGLHLSRGDSGGSPA